MIYCQETETTQRAIMQQSNPGVNNLRHTCYTWHAKQFPMAHRSSKFYIYQFCYV